MYAFTVVNFITLIVSKLKNVLSVVKKRTRYTAVIGNCLNSRFVSNECRYNYKRAIKVFGFSSYNVIEFEVSYATFCLLQEPLKCQLLDLKLD